MPNLVIVDDQSTAHGALMARCADLFVGFDITWMAPRDNLAEQLQGLEAVTAAAIALPFSYSADSAVAEVAPVLTAIEQLTQRGVPVFVAAGNRHENPLGAAGIRITSNFSVPGVQTPKNVGTSGRTVMAAAHYVQCGHLPSS